MTVSTEHTGYMSMVPHWQLMEDVMSSQSDIRLKGATYVPPLDRMTTDQYTAYVNRGSFPMYTKHVIQSFVGMAMRKDVNIDKLPKDIVDNMDGTGVDLTEYTKSLVRNFLVYGRGATLVEWRNNRPIYLFYSAKSIINWKTRVINGVTQLSLVVLQEWVEEDTDMFTHNPVVRYRVLRLNDSNEYEQTVFTYKDEELVDEKTLPTQNHQRMKFIPIVIHGGIDITYPPLLSIAEQNVEWYKLDVDYKHGLHYVAIPTPYVTGVDPEDKDRPMSIGCSEIWYLPDGATAGILEFSGKGLGEISNAKKEIDDLIVILSSRILAPPKSINETATAAAIRNAGETASLAEMVGMLSRELTSILNVGLTWARDDNVCTVYINNDFIPTILSGADVASYVASYLKGGMSFDTLFNVLKDGEIIPGERLLKEEKKSIEEEAKKRAVNEVELADKLAKVKAVKPDTEIDPIKQGKDGEQVNVGRSKVN